MSEHQLYYSTFSRRVSCGEFSDPDPEICECRGSGWFLSQVDTWHACPCHKYPHPEDCEDWYRDNPNGTEEELLAFLSEDPQHDEHVWCRKTHLDEKAYFKRRGIDDDDIPF